MHLLSEGMSPPRLFDAELSQSDGLSYVQCAVLPSLSPLAHSASKHSWPVFIYWQDLYNTLLSCPLTRFHRTKMEMEKRSSHSRKQRYPCTWTGDLFCSVGFLLHPFDTAHTHTHTPHTSFCSCSAPSLVHRPCIIEMWEGLGCSPNPPSPIRE